jgi:uncharacterized protein (TIGR03086 family)
MTTTSAPGHPVTTDPRPHFRSAARTACETVDAVTTDQLHLPTPCTEYDVRSLLGHLVAVFHRVTSVAHGVPAIGPAPLGADVPDDGWGAAAGAAVAGLDAAWADAAVLRQEMVLPFGILPGAAALAMYTGEVTTHTWDLAVATGHYPAWDEQVVAGALAAVHRKLPAERGPGIPFAPPVPVPDGAPAIDRLVAWQGRDPHWRPIA